MEKYNIRGNSAFTLIELLVVVLIIGILAAVALPQYQFAVEKTRLATGLSMMANFDKTIAAYLLENGAPADGFYPTVRFAEANGAGVLGFDSLTCDVAFEFNGNTFCRDGNFAYSAVCGATCGWMIVRCPGGQCAADGSNVEYALLKDVVPDQFETGSAERCFWITPLGKKICTYLRDNRGWISVQFS